MSTSDSDSTLKTNSNTMENPFVTIFLPMNFDKDESPYQVLEELIKDVKSQLDHLTDTASLQPLYKKLNRLIVKLPPSNFCKSVVAFLSKDLEDIIPLNYTVDKKAVIGNNIDFEEIQKYSNTNEEFNNRKKIEEEEKMKLLKLQMETRLFGKRTY